MSYDNEAGPGTAEAVLAALPDGVLVVDSDGRVVFANRLAEELLGYEPGTLAGCVLDQLVQPSERTDHGKRVAARESAGALPMAGGERVSAVRADGSLVAVTVALAPWSGGRTIAVVRDATVATRLTARMASEQHLLRVVADVSAVLARSEPDSDAVLDVATRMLADAIGDSCIVSLVDAPAGLLRPAAFHHRDPEGERVMATALATRPLRLGEGVPGEVALTGRRVVVSDMPDDEIREVTDAEFHAYLDEHPLSAFIVEPLVSSGETLGTLLMSRGTPYTTDEQATVADLAGRIALAVDRARLYRREQDALGRLEQALAQLRAVTDNVAAMVGYWDRDLRNGFANRQYTEYFAMSPEEILGKHISEVIGPELTERNLPYINRVLAGEEVSFPVPMVDVRGRARRMQATYSPSFVDGEVVGFYVLVSDVTEYVMATEALQRSEDRLRLLADRYRMLAENASDVVFRIDVDMGLQWISPSVSEVLGHRVEDIVGRPVTELWHPDDRERLLPELRSRAWEPADYEARFLTRDGQYRWFAVTSRPVRGDDDDQIVGRIGSVRDIESQVAGRQALARSEKLFRLALENAPSGMAVVDLDRRFLEVNPTLCRMVGRDAEWLLQRRVPDVLDPDDDLLDLRRRAMLLAGGDAKTTDEVRLRAAGGRTVWAQHQIGLLRDDDGTPLSFVSQFIDVTEARESREALEYVASHDQLTGVANRAELLHRMARVLGHRPRHGTTTAVLFVDVDDLKPFNDRLGHAAGDALLVGIAARLVEQVRDHDVVARLGGDEFVVFLTELAAGRDARDVADKILAAIRQPIEVEGNTAKASVSIGIAPAHPGDDPEEVIRRADAALYRAKHQGGDTAAM